MINWNKIVRDHMTRTGIMAEKNKFLREFEPHQGNIITTLDFSGIPKFTEIPTFVLIPNYGSKCISRVPKRTGATFWYFTECTISVKRGLVFH